MALRGFLRRHRTAIASNTALAVAAGAIVAYAVSADGYQAHRTALNDGGIWVTKSDRGYFGRVNKPIGRLDGAIPFQPDVDLDVAQDGAAVVGLDVRAGRATGLDPAGLSLADGASASLPDAGQLQMLGGTLATLDPARGAVWAVRFDPEAGNPLVGGVDQQGDPLAEVGKQASLAVTTRGTVLVASAHKDRIATLEADGLQLSEATTTDLDDAAGEPTRLTAVGERAVTLDEDSGQVAAVGGGAATVPAGGVLQQPGPDSDTVLVATPGGLSSMDLESGVLRTLVEGTSGRPTAPVRLGACVYAAWSGGDGRVATICGDGPPRTDSLGGDASQLVFRVNRGEIVLNDRVSGAVWDLDARKPQKIDNWEAFTSTRKVKDEEAEDEEQTTGDRRPPEAKPDRFGARPGRTSVLHPLDNDSAPEGRLLAIRGVDSPTMPGARVAVSPDGQTVQLTLPEDARGTASFDYHVDDGRSQAAHATITVAVRGRAANAAPTLRAGFEPRSWRVPAGGSLEVPVLPDWRDHADSDPLLLETATVVGQAEGGAQVRPTNNGRLRFTAPERGGDVRVEYAVSDGISEPVTRTVRFAVQEKFDQDSHPATAEPDVVSGEVGKPIIVRPLANDLPGSDPSVPDAEIALGGRIADQAGARVRTDLVSGVVRVEASKPGTYLLDYEAAYGNAALAPGRIRVDVRPAAKASRDPVAMPDTLSLFGQSPATVDVLANDVDPAGGVLVVQSARPDDPDQVEVAIVDGRWLRVSAVQGALAPAQQVVRYTISNGASSGVTGEVLVSQRPQPADNTPVTAPDRAVVRAGSVVVHPVLDNDFSPSGDRLDLDPHADAVDGTPGELSVEAPPELADAAGSAFVSGRSVRYVAPSSVEERESVTVSYVARNSTGETAEGRLRIVVIPAEGPNTAPEPPILEGRLVAGDSVKLRVPGTGVDPDGDPVTITGIASAPRLGRLVGFGADALEFQAYPGSVGTEEFTYTVADSRGAEATGVVRVAVVPPSSPQPPVAVADAMTVAPGATARVDVLANDFTGGAERVVVELVDPPAGVSLDSDAGPVRIEAPRQAGADVVEVVYTLSDGLTSSRAVVRLQTVEGYNNPPVVSDAFGQADDSDTVTVDLLDGDAERRAAIDPDGDDSALEVAEVYGDPGEWQLAGNELTVRRGAEPRVVPFRVEDAEGGAATASLYIPATGNGRPYLKPDALIEVDAGERRKVRLSDHIADPSGGSVVITDVGRVWSSPPTQVTVRPTSERGVEVTARSGYRGPAAVLVEVVAEAPDDEASEEGRQGGAAPRPAIVSIPVQVGDDKPEIDCPDTALPVSQSGSIDIDLASVCQVWTPDPADRLELDYTAEWSSEVPGLTVSGDGSPHVRVAAAGSTRAGSEGVLTVRAGDSDPDTVTVSVQRAEPPQLITFTVPDMKPGDTREVDLTRFLRAGVADADPTILDVQRLSGTSVQASPSGAVLRLRAPSGASGRSEFSVEMSDVSADDPGPERRARTRFSVEVLDTPSVPGRPWDIGRKSDRAIRLSWEPSKPQGSPIDHYQVQEIGSGDTMRFRTNSGVFKVPTNGESYSFRVRAHNKAGYSGWSERSRSAVADTTPSRVPWIRQVDQGDGTITIEWGEPRTQTSDIVTYYVRWQNGSAAVDGDLRTFTAPDLDNNRTYTFSIRARNEADTSEPRESGAFQSLGTPATPGGLTISDQQTGNDATTVLLTWNPTMAEGPGATRYTVYARDTTRGGAASPLPGCARIEGTSCRHTGIAYDGRTWAYTVVAGNEVNTSPEGAPQTFRAVGKPAAWGAWSWEPTGADNQVLIAYTVPNARGSQSNVSLLVNGSVQSTWPNQSGSQQRVVTVPSNTSVHSLALQLCNEHSATLGCTTSQPHQVQSYGPLRGHLTAVRAETQGDSIRWILEGSSNGDAAVIDYALDNGPATRVWLTGTGAFTYGTPWQKVGWSAGQRIDVWLRDDDPAGRGESHTGSSATTPDPPVPEVAISRGAACNDDAPDNRCQNAQYDSGPCTASSCAFVVLATNGFVGDHKCEVLHREGHLDLRARKLGELGPFGSAFSAQTPLYVQSGLVQVHCWSVGDNPKQENATPWRDW